MPTNVLPQPARQARPIAALLASSLLFPAAATHASLNLSAVANVDVARPGELATLELTVTNTDPVARTGVVLTMPYPANLNQAFESEFDGDCPATTCSAGETVTWSLGNIASGAAITVDLPAVVATAAAGGTVINFDATVTDDALDTDMASASLTVNSASLYELHLSENSDPALAGNELRYTLSFGYREDAQSVNNSLLSFTVPAGATFVSASDGGTLNGTTVEWPLGFLSPGQQGQRQVRVSLNGGLEAGDIVEAQAEFAGVSSPSDRIGSTAATVIASAQPLGIAIESAVNPLREGALANLQLTVTNNDPFTRIGVTLTGRYPQGFNQVFESEFDGNCASTTCTAGERIVWTLGDIAGGESVAVDLVPVVAANTLADGIVTPLFATAADAFGGAARASYGIRLQTAAVYDLALAEDADPVAASDFVTYKLNAGYRGDATSVSNTRLAFELPTGVSFVSATEGGQFSNGVVEWALGFMAPGDGAIREVTVQVDSAADAAAILRANARLFDVASPLRGTVATANTVVAAATPVGLDIEITPNPVQASETVHAQLTVTNRDAVTRFGFDLAARFPQSTNQLFESEFTGDCGSTTCTAGERVRWALGNIAPGESVTVDLPAMLAASVVDGTIVNLFAWVEDDAGANARLQDGILIDSGAVYDLSLAENRDPAAAGSELTYKLIYGYREDAGAVSNSTLRFALPAGASFVSATGGGVASGNVVEWPLGFLSPGDSGVRNVTVQLDNAMADATVLSAHADVFSADAPDSALRAEAETVIATGAPLQLSIESYPQVIRNGDLSNYQLIVTNADAFTRFGVDLTANFPQGFNQQFESEFDGDCASTTCSSGEKITWLLGNIPAGGAATVDLSPVLGNGPVDGEMINLFATAMDDQGTQTRQHAALRVSNATSYTVSLAEEADPVAAGSLLDYAVTYGYRDDAPAVADSTLQFALPTGTSFVSASGGGVLNGDVVEWPLGFLSPGDGDLRTVTVQVDAGLAAGTVLEASAAIAGSASGADSANSEANTVVGDVPLTLDLKPNRNNAEAGAPLTLLLSVTNNDALTRFGVVLDARYPQWLQTLSESEFDGDCSSTSCTQGERVRWQLGDIAAGDTVTVEMPPTVASGTPDGVIIDFYAAARDDQNSQAHDVQSLLLGCLDSIDSDCDGVSDVADNCLLVPNLGQRDTDGDGIGNYCDADLTGDCQVNFADLGLLKAVFFTNDENADFDGDGDVSFSDLGIMKATFFASPGPSGVPNLCD